MRYTRGGDLAVDTLIQILEHTCQTGILPHLQFSEITIPPGRIVSSVFNIVPNNIATGAT